MLQLQPVKELINSIAGKFCMLFCLLLIFFKINIFENKNIQKFGRVSYSWDQEQDQCFVGPDLGLNCLQRYLSIGRRLKILIQEVLQFMKNCLYLRKHCRH